MAFYVRAVGVNRFTGGGTDKWLKIRSFTKHPTTPKLFTIGVRIKGRIKYVDVSSTKWVNGNLRFAKNWGWLMPVNLSEVISYYKKLGKI